MCSKMQKSSLNGQLDVDASYVGGSNAYSPEMTGSPTLHKFQQETIFKACQWGPGPYREDYVNEVLNAASLLQGSRADAVACLKDQFVQDTSKEQVLHLLGLYTLLSMTTRSIDEIIT